MNEQNDISTNLGTEQSQEDSIFDQIRDLLDKAQQMIYQAQAIVFEGKNKK